MKQERFRYIACDVMCDTVPFLKGSCRILRLDSVTTIDLVIDDLGIFPSTLLHGNYLFLTHFY